MAILYVKLIRRWRSVSYRHHAPIIKMAWRAIICVLCKHVKASSTPVDRLISNETLTLIILQAASAPVIAINPSLIISLGASSRGRQHKHGAFSRRDSASGGEMTAERASCALAQRALNRARLMLIAIIKAQSPPKSNSEAAAFAARAD